MADEPDYSSSGLLKRTRGKGISKNVAQTLAIKLNEEPPKFPKASSAVVIPDRHYYDYIIVGAGPAGSIVANKLYAKNGQLKILILEAGVAPPQDPVFDPRYWVKIQEYPQYEWGYASTYEKGLYGRAIPLPRSPGLGGCTIHNSLMWVRGGKASYDRWKKEYKCDGWGWDDMLPLFDELEGKIKISTVPKPHPLVDACIQAGEETGLNYNVNYNNNEGNEVGVSYNQYTIKHGKRENIFDVYLKELSDAKKVDVKCNEFVNRVLLRECQGNDKWEAFGVECLNKKSHEIEFYGARCEVILTAGVFGSPQILMRSGVGRKEELEEASIECKVDSHGMGRNLADDIFMSVTYTTQEPIPVDFTVYGIGGVIMFPPENNTQITVQSNKMPGLYNIPESWEQGYQIGADCHLAKSRGYMKLDPKQPSGLPYIDMNYLDKEEDLQQCILAVKQIRQVGNAEALKSWGPVEVMPGPAIQSAEALAVYVRGTAFSTMHPSGTCRMGPSEDSISNDSYPAVLDSNTLKVFRCEKLRVMDNSVFPENPQGNPAAAVFAVASKGAQMIIKDM